MGYWEIQKSPDSCLRYERVTTPLTSEKCWIFFGLGGVRVRHRAKLCSQRHPSPAHRELKGLIQIPIIISYLYLNFPHAGENKTSLHQAEKPDSKQQNRLEFTFPQLPDSSFTQMKQAQPSGHKFPWSWQTRSMPRIMVMRHPAGGFCIYLDDPFCKLFLLLSVNSRLLLKLSLKLLYRYILYR